MNASYQLFLNERKMLCQKKEEIIKEEFSKKGKVKEKTIVISFAIPIRWVRDVLFILQI